MNRAQFMEQLEKLLSDISEEERQEALDYYESYFDDAGEDQEANVIRELGSPGKVAAIIKADLRESSQNYGEYTENGFQDDRVKEDMQMPEQRGSRAERGYHAERKGSNAGVILVLILLVFISPLIKGAVGGVLGFIVALALLPLFPYRPETHALVTAESGLSLFLLLPPGYAVPPLCPIGILQYHMHSLVPVHNTVLFQVCFQSPVPASVSASIPM